MMNMKYLLWCVALMIATALSSCIEDGFTTAAADQPRFSVDTLHIGNVYAEETSSTQKFIVYNPHDKGLKISSIKMSGEYAEYFKLNVDGFSGDEFTDVEIRANDSIYVFVSANIPSLDDGPIRFEFLNMYANIDFVTNGVSSHVAVDVTGQNVTRLRAYEVAENERFNGLIPYMIYDSLVVAEGATLTLDAGAHLVFHDGARMIVRGSLKTNGTAEKYVTFEGDRTGEVISGVSFDIMSRQWDGVYFTPSSHDNSLSHTIIRNTTYGVTVLGDESRTPDLTMVNSRLRNSGDLVLEAIDAKISAYGCEFAEAANGLVRLEGGEHMFNHCTFANNYLFSVIAGPAVTFAHFMEDSSDESPTPLMKATFTNSIIYGYGNDVSHGDLTGTNVVFNTCLLKSAGENDDNFINCLWNTDPLFYTEREEYFFDYRLRPDSPAIGAADASLTDSRATVDGYDRQRGSQPDLGAYVYTPPTE